MVIAKMSLENESFTLYQASLIFSKESNEVPNGVP